METFVASTSVAEKAFIEANAEIATINADSECDYLVNDFAACVAVGAVIKDDEVSWSSIGDCRIAHFSQDDKLTFISPSGLENFERHLKTMPGNWRKPARRVLIRKEFRNNPFQVLDDKLVSYGALTGEEAAESFIDKGSFSFTEGTVILFSDGLTPLVQLPEFMTHIT